MSVTAAYVFVGGGLGAVARYFVSMSVAARTDGGFPYPTLFVNLVGALIIGALVEAIALKVDISQQTRAFLITGILGGFTTFSAFSLESVMLIERGAYLNLCLYVLASVFGTIGLALLAMRATRLLLP